MTLAVTEETWRSININASFGTLKAKKISINEGVLIANDHSGYRHLLLPVERNEETITDKGSRGLTVQGRNLVIDGKPESSYLDIKCNDQSAHKVFNLIINEILEQLHNGFSINESVVKVLNRWRSFWTGGNRNALSEEQIKGLFGELWFLLTWLLPRGKEKISTWSGPTNSRHDIESASYSVEIKTTSSIRGHIHKIHGIEQLDSPDNGNLLLFSLRVRGEKTASNSLPLLIEKITSILSDDTEKLETFQNMLSYAGIHPEHLEDYSEYKYRIVDERLYKVDNNFPKITLSMFENGIPPGVERLDYEINLNSVTDNILCNNPHDWVT